LTKSLQVPAGVEVVAGADDEVVGVSQTHFALQPQPRFQQLPTLDASPHDLQPEPGAEGSETVPLTQLQLSSIRLPCRAQVAALMWSVQVAGVAVPTQRQRASAVWPLAQHFASDEESGHDV
jgi:hypothetical protein